VVLPFQCKSLHKSIFPAVEGRDVAGESSEESTDVDTDAE